MVAAEVVTAAPLTAAQKKLVTAAIRTYVGDLDAVIDMGAIRASGLRLGVDPLGGERRGQWQVSAREALRQAHEIRAHPLVLAGEHLAGTAEAADHLVGDEGDVAALAANMARMVQEAERWPAMGEAGAKRAREEFNVDTWNDLLMERLKALKLKYFNNWGIKLLCGM